MNSRMLYLGPSILNMKELERIYQAAMFCADEILVPMSLSISQHQSKEESDFIKRKIIALVEIGAIQPWTFEGLSHPKVFRPIENMGDPIIISSNEYIALSEKINANLMKFRHSQHLSNIVESKRHVVQGIGEIVEGRRMLWSIGSASVLKADRVLLNPNGAEAISYQFQSLFARSRIEQKALEEFLRVISVGPFCQLSSEELVDRRKYLPHFAQLMRERASQVSAVFATEEEILRVGEQLGVEFLKKIDSLKKGPTWKSFLSRHYSNITWDIVGLLFSPSIVVRYLVEVLRWRKEKEKNLPFFVVPITTTNSKTLLKSVKSRKDVYERRNDKF